MQATFQVDILIKNIGHSVAVHTDVGYTLALPQWSDRFAYKVLEEQKKYCAEFLAAKQDAASGGVLLFPDDPYHWHGATGNPIKPENTNHTPNMQAGYIVPVLIGCVNYRLSENSAPYQTGFAYHLLHTTGNRLFEIGRDVPMKDIRLDRNPTADYAK
jgi:hypothetical protein